jgi:hypothetical protein
LLFFFAPATTLRRAGVVGRRSPAGEALGVQRAVLDDVVVVVVVVVVMAGDDVDVRRITAVRMTCSRAVLSLSRVRLTSPGRARACVKRLGFEFFLSFLSCERESEYV